MKKTLTGNVRKDTIVVPIGQTVANHLEYEVTEEADGTFSVFDLTAGTAPNVKYTGFPRREDAERFVLAQPEPWR